MVGSDDFVVVCCLFLFFWFCYYAVMVLWYYSLNCCDFEKWMRQLYFDCYDFHYSFDIVEK